MAAPLDTLVEKLTKALGQNLVTVVLYGSAATGDHQESFSDYNVLCVLDVITPAQLAATEPVFQWWKQRGNPSPLLLTEHELKTSTDCFSIEFHDLREYHKILFGRDVVSMLDVDRTFYRAQVERELRSKLLRLRQKASGILSDKAVLRRLLVDSISTFCVLFRHALILHGVDTPPKKREVITKAAARFGINAQPFEQLLALRENTLDPKNVDPMRVLPEYLAAVGTVIDAVDAL